MGLITMASFLDFTSPVKLRHTTYPVTLKSSTPRLRFLDPPVKCIAIRSATDSDKATTEPSAAADPSVAETKITDVETPPPPARAPLTAREKLRTARVLSRYADAKPSKPRMGSKVLEALRESDGGKGRSGLPRAPANLLDDSKRGMPKKGLTFDLPGGTDLFFIVLSFVLISTAMFATTFLVWKLGTIHFNEY